MQRAIRRQDLDGGHFGAVLHDGEREAGIDPPPVHQHGTRAALAVITGVLRARQVEMVAVCLSRELSGCPRECAAFRRALADEPHQRRAGTLVLSQEARVILCSTLSWFGLVSEPESYGTDQAPSSSRCSAHPSGRSSSFVSRAALRSAGW